MKLFVCGLLAAVMLTASSFAATGDRVVAVVNDQVITKSQLDSRVELNIRQAGITKPTADQKLAVVKRTLSMLIDEELQRQYAVSSGIEPTKSEISEAKKQAQESLGPQWNSLTKGLEASAGDKIAAELRWQRILDRDVKPRVEIGTTEVDRLIEQLAKSRHVLEREISMILLTPGEGTEDKEKLQKLNEIRERVVKGASFSDEAKAYSDDKSAVNGGKLGWFASGELNPELEDALDKMQPGDVSEPIRTPLGWHLIKLENVRTTKPVETGPVTQNLLYFLGVAATSDTKVLKEAEKKIDKTTRSVTKQSEVEAYFGAKQYAVDFPASVNLGWVQVDDLQPDVAKALDNVKAGRWSDTVTVGGNIGRIYLADSQQVMPKNLEVYRAKVMESLASTRAELGARRFMRELRQKAFVDVRL